MPRLLTHKKTLRFYLSGFVAAEESLLRWKKPSMFFCKSQEKTETRGIGWSATQKYICPHSDEVGEEKAECHNKKSCLQSATTRSLV
jgi:hypothetical protein